MVTASRSFVCVRPKSFEDWDESELLLSIFSGRTGRLENTVFTILDAEGEKQLTRSGRSPKWVSEDADEFAALLNELAEEHVRPTKAKARQRSLPTIKGLKLAMNVAACDSMPLVLAVGRDEKATKKLSDRLAPLAWSDELIGRFRWVSLAGTEELSEVKGLPAEPGLYVVQTDAYGITCELLSQAKPTAKEKALSEALRAGLQAFDPPRTRRRGMHVREGERKGYSWEHATGHSERVPFTGKKG